jgi:hypothetical protein
MNNILLSFLLILTIQSFGQSNLVINEFMSDNTSTIVDEDGDYSDWIELYNSGITPIDLQGYGISDNENVSFQWTFPSYILQPGAFIIIFASNKNQIGSSYYHTNFKISASGEFLTLTDPSGTLIDRITPTPLSEDISYGRSEDGGNLWERLREASPDQSNAVSNGIIFSHESGFYQSALNLSLTSTNGHEIRYTTNGDNPDTNSIIITTPLVLDTLYSYSDTISNISTSPYWVAPTIDILKAHVIKAATFDQGLRTSNIYTKVIFIDSNLNERFEEYDIVSVVTEPSNLFDLDSGIYVPGVNFSSSNTTWTGNYFQKGDLWEKKANLQYFNTDGDLQFNQEIGIRAHGGKGRNLPQKSLRFYTKGDEGAHKLNYPFFEHLGEDKRVFDKVVLRNSMTCWNNTVIKDEVTSHVCRNLDFEFQHSKPVIVFINGNYWGVQSIREYFDEKYINEKYNYPEDSINIVMHGSGNRLPVDYGIDAGNNLGKIQLYDFLNNNDLDIQANYQYVESMLDIGSIVDYYCTEIYFNNKDWPTNNNKLWNNGTYGEWRQMLYDVDGGWQYLGTSYNQLSRALSATGSAQNAPYATFLLRKLFESQEFEDQFISRMACLMKNDFDADTVVNAVTFMEDLYTSGMQDHIDRWHRPTSYGTWTSGVNGLISFANGRKNYVIQHIDSQFGIDFDPEDFDCGEVIEDTVFAEVIDLENQLRIYPNPTINKFIWIDFDFESPTIEFEILNLSGQIIRSGNVQNHERIQIDFSSGIYFFSTVVRGKRLVKRIVIV